MAVKKASRNISGGVVFGRNLKFFRECRGWTQTELATKIGAQQTLIGRLETSPDSNPTLETVFTLADALGVPAHHFLADPPIV